MLFENFDKKIKEAAERHHPAYDEKAWAKMEKLLDKHMPVEENRRRRFLFILFLLAGLGIAGFIMVQQWKKAPDQLVAKETTSVPVKPPATQELNEEPVQKELTIQSPASVEKQVVDENETENISNQQKQYIKDLSIVGSGKKKVTTIRNDNQVPDKNEGAPVVTREISKEPVHKTDNNSDTKDIIETVSNKVVDEAKKVSDPAMVKEEKTVNPLNTIETKQEKDQTSTNLLSSKKKKSHAFLFTAGGGPDISFVRAGSPGTVKLFGGAGIGYVYNNRVSIRTGFYSGRKIYSAEADDYNPPPGFSLYYPYLQKVDANCKIYEIPIAVGYHFGKNKKQFFVSASVSSYFMKEETYNYHYKYTPTGPTVSRERSMYDVNKHYFAGLGISGGYTHHLTPRISLTVEPYAKLPLKGVGYGKVKLNSTGVLFSAGIEPFGSKKK